MEVQVYDYQFSDPIFTAWMQFRQAWTAVYRLSELELAKLGLTPIKVYVLWVCRDYDGPLTPAELSRLVFRESNSIVQLLARMEKEGLISRIPKRKGHPFTEIHITAKGKELVEPAIKLTRVLSTNILSSLSPQELNQFQKLLQKVQQKALAEMWVELKPAPAALSRWFKDIQP